jgi:hypothetical protein
VDWTRVLQQLQSVTSGQVRFTTSALSCCVCSTDTEGVSLVSKPAVNQNKQGMAVPLVNHFLGEEFFETRC